jgi:hypothetical protein
MKNLLRYLAFALMIGGACAQSNLPACPLADEKKMSNCWGRFVYPQGTVWVGELKGGIPNGEGILYSNGGKILESGILNGTSLISSYKIDPSRYPNEILGGAYAQSNWPACPSSGYFHNCFGTYTYDGIKYFGEWKDNKWNGRGTLSFDSGTKYVGEFKDGKYSGQGTYTSSSGSKYVGEWKDNKYNGHGTLSFSNGVKYVGELKDGKYNGQGTLFAPNGSIINQGIWADDKFVGSETVQQASVANQTSATAVVQPNIPTSNLPACHVRDTARWTNCFGTYTFPDGGKYVGEWVDNKVNGQGTLTFAISGATYVGEFKDGQYSGQGTFTFANGDKYVGEWKDNRHNGQGTLFGSNGLVINQGIWADGKLVRSAPAQQAIAPSAQPSGAERDRLAAGSKLPACPVSGYFNNCFGTFVFPSGERYVGEFRDNLRHGQGSFYTSSGSVVSEGLWSDGMFVRQLSVQQAISQTAQPSSAERDRFNAEIEVERKKRQELEQQLAAAKERERITAELDQERKKRQELEAQLAASPQSSSPQFNAPRRTAHALVIGNGAYPGSGRLDNPVNDANAISQKLRSMGFIVTTVTDANRQRLVQSMAQFRRTAAAADISLLYYAGHGVQIFGTNYILPTDVDQTDPAQATIQGVSLNSVVENFLPGKTKLVFLDACRDNALQRTNDRSVSKGLAPISAAEGTLISYATKDGQTAADGVGSKNSPFTQALLEHLNDPQDIAVVLRKVRERVMKITGGKQQPWEYGSPTGGELVLSAIKPK